MDYNWVLIYFSRHFFDYLLVKDIFSIAVLEREINSEYKKNIHWENKYRELFKPNKLTEKLGYKSTLKLLVYSSKICCVCLEPLWKNPKEKNYLHVCDCNFSGLFLRSHEDCIKKYFISDKNDKQIEYINCPFCKKKKMSIPIQITS